MSQHFLCVLLSSKSCLTVTVLGAGTDSSAPSMQSQASNYQGQQASHRTRHAVAVVTSQSATLDHTVPSL